MLGFLASVIGCTSAVSNTARTTPESGQTAPLADPGTLRSPTDLGFEVQWRQRVTATWGDATRTFEAVLSNAEGELLLIALGPMDTPGFIVRLAEGTVALENRTGEAVPFDPRYIMLDVQRTFFPWIPGAPPQQGERRHAMNGETIVERWEAGHLVQRRFARVDGQPPDEIVIDYDGWSEDREAPGRARMVHGWFDYSLVIETLSEQRL